MFQEKHCLLNQRDFHGDMDVVEGVSSAWAASEKSLITDIFGVQCVRMSKWKCGHTYGVCDSQELILSLPIPEGKRCTLQVFLRQHLFHKDHHYRSIS